MSNYKNFKNRIAIDFSDVTDYEFNTKCILNSKLIGKTIIYGRNATGKTNLGRAITDIRSIFRTSPQFLYRDVYTLNADSSEKATTFEYTFLFDDKEIYYQYAKTSQGNILTETLKIDQNVIYDLDLTQKRFLEIDRSLLNIDEVAEKKYLDILHTEDVDEEMPEPNIPFLRWLISNVGFPSDSPLLNLKKYVFQMVFLTVPEAIRRNRYPGIVIKLYEWLYTDVNNLKHFEQFLNAMGLECQLAIKKLPDEQYELYFVHKEKLIPFQGTASSGTLALFDLYRAVVWRGVNLSEMSFLYLDEFDAFYHYEMAERVIKYFKEYMPQCQIILTTHNTNLMSNEHMRPDCIFILSRQGTLTPLVHATTRELKEGHNLEKMYISGEFQQYE